eukprot:6701587-Alexandrium_andersonii.AAC.1
MSAMRSMARPVPHDETCAAPPTALATAVGPVRVRGYTRVARVRVVAWSALALAIAVCVLAQ